tara:strand:+ start:14736 stop:15137 length:402 start_codon:yes stop_codon:yes gene_type:complete
MGSSSKGAGAGYQGPSEAELAARRAEERAEAARQRREARLNALEDARRQQEADEAAASKKAMDEAEALAAREKREEMVGQESEAQTTADLKQQQDIMGVDQRYGAETRPGGGAEARPMDKKKRTKKPGTGRGA